MYVEIVKQLRVTIEKEDLKHGDNLPSERERSERLNVGRSSVREEVGSLIKNYGNCRMNNDNFLPI
ncbi:GntR family transcriptional regulator [Bacillus sp. FJAT-29790]|nr:GntR family transcriptional regulator [Bacillus sp. FJAT-29790]